MLSARVTNTQATCRSVINMRFVHTADWQIGMKAAHVGAAAETVRDERLQAARRVVEVAEQAKAEFILLAGDTFENNGVDRILIQRTADILGRFRGEVYLLPGNHDPLVPCSVWEHRAWASHGNLHFLDKAEPLEVPGGVIYPCPVREEHSSRNPVQWIEATDSKGVAVGVAHGTVEGLQMEEPEYPIPRGAPIVAGLDYLALGHWHSTATYADSDNAVRMAYSGSHEPTKFGERDSGNVLLVEIEARGKHPIVTPMKTGRLSWRIIEQELRQPGDLARVFGQVDGVEDPASTLLDLRIKGVIWADESQELSRIWEVSQSRFLFGRLDDSYIAPYPDDESWVSGLPAGSLRDAALRLCELADPSYSGERPQDTSFETASRALLELYALVTEVSR